MRGTAIAVALAFALCAAGASAQTPRELSCAALLASDGALPYSSEIRDPLDAALADDDEATLPASDVELPETVRLRTRSESLNARWWFALRDGHIYLKPNADRTGVRKPWRRLLLPGCIDGRVREISADGVNLIVTDEQRRVFTATAAQNSPARFAWTARWGPYLWTGLGLRLPADVISWAGSDLNPAEDGTWRDRTGRDRAIAGITFVYELRSDQTTITVNDPWLPADESKELCGPRRGRVRGAALSASGSTVLLIGRRGELYTRLWDFDISGANTVLMDYSYEDPELPQLPAPGWVRQPDVPGRPTDLVSVEKHGKGSVNRLLRVEGRSRRGRTGYFEKDLNQGAAAPWHFVATGAPLRGRLLPRPPRGRRAGPVAPRLDLRWAGTVAGRPAEIADFHPVCSPSTLIVDLGGGERLRLVVHSVDALRQQQRAPRLQGAPREYLAAIEAPASLTAAGRAFVDGALGGKRFSHTPLVVSPGGMRFTDLCWTLGPAPPPPQLTLDPGEMLGRATAALDGRRAEPPPAC